MLLVFGNSVRQTGDNANFLWFYFIFLLLHGKLNVYFHGFKKNICLLYPDLTKTSLQQYSCSVFGDECAIVGSHWHGGPSQLMGLPLFPLLTI